MAGGAEHQAPFGPVEQGQSQLTFEAAQLPRQRRLGDAQPLRGGRDRAGVRDGHERAQRGEIHGPDHAAQA
jgi:hypothetical protein